MQEFRVFRAIGLAFSAWFRNFIPFTILAFVLYGPIIVWMKTQNLEDKSIEEVMNYTFLYPIYAVAAVSTLMAPMLIYRVVGDLRGEKVSMLTSIKYGARGILPAIILAIVTNVVQLAPLGSILSSIITCIWFVAAPAAVAERLGPIEALSRSANLTKGRRWGIFGLTFLIGLAMVAILFAMIMPAIEKGEAAIYDVLTGSMFPLIIIIAVFQMFTGIVAAVSYALLRQDKDGVSHEELARIFE